jgi:hypothetical protein
MSEVDYKLTGTRTQVIATVLVDGKGVEQNEFDGPVFTKETNHKYEQIEESWKKTYLQAESWAIKRCDSIERGKR